MRKLLFSALLWATCSVAGHTQPSSADLVRIRILEETADALKRGDSDEYLIWYVMVTHLNRPDIEDKFKTGFPMTLDLHIDRKSSLAGAAKRIKLKLKSKRT